MRQCRRSPLSLSTPRISSEDRAVLPRVPFNEQPTRQAGLRAKARFILRTDITNFYPSVYTHSIPWALHTKAKAKVKRGPKSLLGNALDKLVREAQHGQTIGLPIGPDTSFVIAEMILSSIDEEVCTRMEDVGLSPNGYRTYDDYELGFATRADAETAASILQKVLSEYELQLNPSKTDIIQLPIPIEPAWVSELRTFRFEGLRQTWNLRRYFDRAFELSRLNGDSEVLKYAIRRLRSVDITEDDWEYFQDVLLQCAMVESSALPVVIDNLHFYKDEDFPINVRRIGDVLNIMLSSHAQLGHGSEVAWALWGCLLFDIKIKAGAARAVTEMEDAFAALLLLDAQNSGLIRGKIDSQNWQTAMTKDGLRSSQWILSYEANIKGWLTSKNDFVSNDMHFSILKQRNVSFYDADKVTSHVPSEHFQPQWGWAAGWGY